MSDMTPVQVEGALACDYAGETAVGLLDALMESMVLVRPGRSSAKIASDLYRLGDGAAYVAQELEALVSGRPAPEQGPALPPQSGCGQYRSANG